MPLVWLALAGAIVLTVASLVFLTLRVLDAFRAFKHLGNAAGAGLDRISKASVEMERHLELAAAGGTRLDASLTRLQESRARLTVLTTALDDARASLRSLTGLVPRK